MCPCTDCFRNGIMIEYMPILENEPGEGPFAGIRYAVCPMCASSHAHGPAQSVEYY